MPFGSPWPSVTAQNSEQGLNQQAADQSIPSRQLDRPGVRQMQQALNKSGHRVGRTDGIMGPRTREALQNYQKSKGMQANGKINRQILADLGVQVAQPNRGRQPANQGTTTSSIRTRISPAATRAGAPTGKARSTMATAVPSGGRDCAHDAGR